MFDPFIIVTVVVAGAVAVVAVVVAVAVVVVVVDVAVVGVVLVVVVVGFVIDLRDYNRRSVYFVIKKPSRPITRYSGQCKGSWDSCY